METPEHIVLTIRETEVVRLVGSGRSSKQIALVLGIAPKTVESYVEHARLKLSAVNRSHLMVRAALLGILEDEQDGASARLSRPDRQDRREEQRRRVP